MEVGKYVFCFVDLLIPLPYIHPLPSEDLRDSDIISAVPDSMLKDYDGTRKN